MLTKQQNQKGFTLIELIIVVSIIAVLAALAFMSLSGETAQARDSKRVSDLKTFEDSIATSNGKNKKIDYTNTALGSVQDTSVTTNVGKLYPLRGAHLVPVKDGLFDSDVLPTASRDPKGSVYYAAFLSTTDYQLFATAENPDTKTPTALVRGPFKEGAILDILTEDINETDVTFTVANPQRFVAGDKVKIDNEEMEVASFNPTTSELTVLARGASKKVHNKGATIKLVDAANGADGLVCFGTLQDTSGNAIADATDWSAEMTVAGSKGVVCKEDSTVSNGLVGSGTITGSSDKLALPYTVTAE